MVSTDKTSTPASSTPSLLPAPRSPATTATAATRTGLAATARAGAAAEWRCHVARGGIGPGEKAGKCFGMNGRGSEEVHGEHGDHELAFHHFRLRLHRADSEAFFRGRRARVGDAGTNEKEKDGRGKTGGEEERERSAGGTLGRRRLDSTPSTSLKVIQRLPRLYLALSTSRYFLQLPILQAHLDRAGLAARRERKENALGIEYAASSFEHGDGGHRLDCITGEPPDASSSPPPISSPPSIYFDGA